ncbi:class I SAM-dependent methyltransferase [Streptomyces sp. TRM 70361]|uniref:class I SAM-dependent methyltransferase n=1 Tax=Streptomyces sp. TRM 70361 TaxID=3116553 RepID=UPI002E7AC2FA|nr:class I SAM-dependent methyltransferase [Streptomyces sp. TRM 70361]MEE1940686.1 class I SAM-dependent methyltransferase [Streptomyces sp. TRM 70361]
MTAPPHPPRPAPSPAGDGLPWRAGPYARALRTGRGPLYLRRSDDGRLLPLEVERWCAGADEADRTVLRRCAGPVLDIGCGPGRLVAALAALGRPVLGIDTAPEAVARTRALGGAALCRSVFGPLPGEGRWGSALLLDGNIGIGGDPAALLERVRALLAPGGLLLAEAAPEEVEERVEVRLDDGGGGGAHPWFPWARLGRTALRRRARAGGWTVTAQWSAYGRSFLALRGPADRADRGTHRAGSPRATGAPAAAAAVTSAVTDTASSQERG